MTFGRGFIPSPDHSLNVAIDIIRVRDFTTKEIAPKDTWAAFD